MNDARAVQFSFSVIYIWYLIEMTSSTTLTWFRPYIYVDQRENEPDVSTLSTKKANFPDSCGSFILYKLRRLLLAIMCMADVTCP